MIKKIFLLLIAVMLLATGCSARQEPVKEAPPEAAQDHAEPQPPNEPEPKAPVPPEVPEATPPAEAAEPPAGSTKVNFEIDSLQFSLFLPETWTAEDNTILIQDTVAAEVRPTIPNSDGKAMENLAAQHPDAEPPREVTVGALNGKCYFLQTEVTKGGMTVFENELIYYLDTGDKLLSVVFYPMRGIGIGTQREAFEAVLNTIQVA